MKPSRVLCLQGRAQRRCLRLLHDLADDDGFVSREELVTRARESGALAVAPAAIESTISRVLPRLFEHGLIDVSEYSRPTRGLWLRERIALFAREAQVEPDEHVEAWDRAISASSAPPTDVSSNWQVFTTKCRAAMATGQWSDAMKCVRLRIRGIRLVEQKGTRRRSKGGC